MNRSAGVPGNRPAVEGESLSESPLLPALEQLGTAKCPICGHEVAIYRTKTNRPFLNCGFCSARIFYNGREAIRRLLEGLTVVGTDELKISKDHSLL